MTKYILVPLSPAKCDRDGCEEEATHGVGLEGMIGWLGTRYCVKHAIEIVIAGNEDVRKGCSEDK